MLGEIYQLLQQILGKLEHMEHHLRKLAEFDMSFYDDVKAELVRQTNLLAGMKSFIKTLTDQIQANINDPVAQQAILDSVKANDDNLAALMVANTPAATTPVPAGTADTSGAVADATATQPANANPTS